MLCGISFGGILLHITLVLLYSPSYTFSLLYIVAPATTVPAFIFISAYFTVDFVKIPTAGGFLMKVWD